MNWQPQGRDPLTGCMMYQCGALKVLVADPESTEYKETKRWHLSISTPHRYPRWEEIKDARYSFIPNEIVMTMYLPPKEEYINFHPNCFHLHECTCTETLSDLKKFRGWHR